MVRPTKRIRKRTRGRELALQYLYQWDLLHACGCEDKAAFLAEQEPDEETREFALALIDGTLAHQDEIDRIIDAIAQNWSLARMLVVDRTILRIATYELTCCQDAIPPRVAINEAIELAKKYSTDKSSAFVNGILDRVPKVLAEKSTAKLPAVSGAASESSATQTAVT